MNFHWIEILGGVLLGIVMIPMLLLITGFLIYEAGRGILNFSLAKKIQEWKAYWGRLKDDRFEQFGCILLAILFTGVVATLYGSTLRTPISVTPYIYEDLTITATERGLQVETEDSSNKIVVPWRVVRDQYHHAKNQNWK